MAALLLENLHPDAARRLEDEGYREIKVSLKAHDVAMSSHSMDGVLACFAPDVVLMGSGPGELWTGTDETKEAYTKFFEGFDKGEHDFHYNYKFGGLSADMGWLVVSGEVNGKKEG